MKQYILTLTLYEHLCAFKRVGLKIPEQSIVDEIEGDLTDRIKQVFAGTQSVVEVIPFSDFCDEIVSVAKDLMVQMPDSVIVSTTPMIVYDTGGICIGLSRLIDVHGNIIAVGSRASSASVDKQIELIRPQISGRRVIILEDGSFTGNTLCYMIQKLSDYEAEVVAVVLGILFPDAKKKLNETFKGELIYNYHFEEPIDWMPSHDFFPFVPNAGRVIGSRVGDSVVPTILVRRSTVSKPYILPYAPIEKWAGLPLSDMGMLNLSKFCMDGSIRIFIEMERLNGRPILIGDLVDTRPTTSVPVPMGVTELDFYGLTERVIDVLYMDRLIILKKAREL